MQEYAQVNAECLAEAGFPVELRADGQGWDGISLAPGQAQAFDEALYLCDASYPMEPKYYQPYNDDQLGAWYQHLATDTVDCLTSLGYIVTEQPPTEDVWIATYRAGAQGLWHPVFDSVPEAELGGVTQQCPNHPENFYDLASIP